VAPASVTISHQIRPAPVMTYECGSIHSQIHLALATTSERGLINGHIHLTLALQQNSGKKDRREVVEANTRRWEGGGYLSRSNLRPAVTQRGRNIPWINLKSLSLVVTKTMWSLSSVDGYREHDEGCGIPDAPDLRDAHLNVATTDELRPLAF
jgi:hypothetical protein